MDTAIAGVILIVNERGVELRACVESGSYITTQLGPDDVLALYSFLGRVLALPRADARPATSV